MRVLLIALFAAISYAQTADELEKGSESKVSMPRRSNKFSNPENIAGVKERDIYDDMYIEIPLSIGSDRQLLTAAALVQSGIQNLENKAKAAKSMMAGKAASAAASIAGSIMPGKVMARAKALFARFAEQAKQWSPKESAMVAAGEKIYRKLQQGLLTTNVLMPLWVTFKEVAESLAELYDWDQATQRATQNGATAGEILAEVVSKNGMRFWTALKKFAGFSIPADERWITFSVGGGTSFSFGLGLSYAVMFNIGWKNNGQGWLVYPHKAEAYACSVSMQGLIGFGPEVQVSAALPSVQLSFNTAAGDEAGFGMAVDIMGSDGIGVQGTLNWAYRKHRMEFSGFGAAILTGAGAGGKWSGTYTVTLFKFELPRNLPIETAPEDDSASDAGSSSSYNPLVLLRASPAQADYRFDVTGFQRGMDRQSSSDITGELTKEDVRGIMSIDEAAKQADAEPLLLALGFEPASGQSKRVSATSKDNILELINPTILEYSLGALLLFALVLYSSRKAESKDEYLLVGNHDDEL